jgi:hypothetical protein
MDLGVWSEASQVVELVGWEMLMESREIIPWTTSVGEVMDGMRDKIKRMISARFMMILGMPSGFGIKLYSQKKLFGK